MTTHQFTILKNGIDTRLEIIQDNETGFYNITKTAKMIADLSKNEGNSENNEPCRKVHGSNKMQKEANNEGKSENNKPAGILAGITKRSRDWFINDTTQSLIDEVIKQT